ncbi:MAG: nucleotidyltransferase [Oscillospiraceae bacterium]|nr:nucleotidyltransferase [Oscillospiraceae bacterium]
MYDLSAEFEKFYKDKVVLPQATQSELREKKKLNIDRLKNGLAAYNKDNKTSYEVADVREQGSIAMSTVTQNDSSNYDIDVAIIFDSTNIAGVGHIAIKNVVEDALRRSNVQWKKEPTALTNCVRVEYAEGYHVDFAVYRRAKQWDDSYSYEHAGGSSWQERDPDAINEWFKDAVSIHGVELRKIVRLSKMFCKSRSHWPMPGGLLQSVLSEEKLAYYDRLDEQYYHTMVAIKNRLLSYIEVYNPAYYAALVVTERDKAKMNNWKTRLCDELKKLSVLFEDDCDNAKALSAWHGFFCHDFWDASIESKSLIKSLSHTASDRGPHEEFIDEKVSHVRLAYSLKIDCEATANGIRTQRLTQVLLSRLRLFRNQKLKFYIASTDAPIEYCDIYWKVRNVGYEAIKRGMVRGEIRRTQKKEQRESADFHGPHFVECYLVKNGECVAMDRIDVPIE